MTGHSDRVWTCECGNQQLVWWQQCGVCGRRMPEPEQRPSLLRRLWARLTRGAA